MRNANIRFIARMLEWRLKTGKLSHLKSKWTDFKRLKGLVLVFHLLCKNGFFMNILPFDESFCAMRIYIVLIHKYCKNGKTQNGNASYVENEDVLYTIEIDDPRNIAIATLKNINKPWKLIRKIWLKLNPAPSAVSVCWFCVIVHHKTIKHLSCSSFRLFW